jgi:rod shape determining protein RodA
MTVLPMSRLAVSRTRVAVPRLDWLLVGSAGLILTIGTMLVWSATSSNDLLTQGDSTAYLHKHLVNIVIGLVLAAAVMATDHRWVRIVTPLVYVGSVIGLLLVLVMGR